MTFISDQYSLPNIVFDIGQIFLVTNVTSSIATSTSKWLETTFLLCFYLQDKHNTHLQWSPRKIYFLNAPRLRKILPQRLSVFASPVESQERSCGDVRCAGGVAIMLFFVSAVVAECRRRAVTFVSIVSFISNLFLFKNKSQLLSQMCR